MYSRYRSLFVILINQQLLIASKASNLSHRSYLVFHLCLVIQTTLRKKMRKLSGEMVCQRRALYIDTFRLNRSVTSLRDHALSQPWKYVLLKEQGHCIGKMQMSSICNTYADPYITASDTLWICGSIHKLKLGLLACIPVFVATLRYSLLLFYSSLTQISTTFFWCKFNCACISL